VGVESVSKSFRLPQEAVHTLKERVLHPFRRPGFDKLDALHDVSFEVETGEFFGIVGRNGSGKSTLLKCLAGIYAVDDGEIRLRGRLAPFIELGVGFNPEMTAHENVLLNAVMLGLTPREARRRYDTIIEFAELEEFTELKLKNYSSGMHVRLAFSVMLQVDADVLLIDEVLAVGDASFQQKCFDQFTRLSRERKTIIFVTHDMASVRRYCDRAMLLERGHVIDIADPEGISRSYNELNFGRIRVGKDGVKRKAGPGGSAEITLAWIENAAGERVGASAQGDPCVVAFEVKVNEELKEPVLSIAVLDEARNLVFSTYEDRPGTFAAGSTVVVRLRFENWLAAGRYTFTAGVARSGPGADMIDIRKDITSVVVHTTRPAGGAVNLPHEFSVSR